MPNTSYVRKLDSMGRIMIPIRLREALGLTIGKDYEIQVFTMNGRKYVGIDCGPVEETDLAAAIKALEDAGFSVFKN